ncbi:MAG TPA: carbon monoxide dehydrogenase subunit G [Steroidobacteraceae bacterium]|nr:carbon monoxide dehydrogenase subunit G [Steroidobacteraceae bacterium]
MTGERTLPVERASAWRALNDPQLLKRAIPGCESLLANAAGGYDLVITAAIGPVRARFKGSMQLADVVAPESYTIRFEGQGGPAGFARGDAHVSLTELTGSAARRTSVRYRVSAQVGGRLAQVGSRLIDAAAGAMADQFFGSFSALLAAPAEAAGSGAPVAGLGLRTLLKAFLRRLFRRDRAPP